MNIAQWILQGINRSNGKDVISMGWNPTVYVTMSLISILKDDIPVISTCWPLSLPVVLAMAIRSPTCHPIWTGSCFVRNVFDPACASALKLLIIFLISKVIELRWKHGKPSPEQSPSPFHFAAVNSDFWSPYTTKKTRTKCSRIITWYALRVGWFIFGIPIRKSLNINCSFLR